MSLTLQQLADLDARMSDLADERLSDEGRTALAELLRADPGACDHYIRYMALCSDLHDAAATALSARDADEPENGPAIASFLSLPAKPKPRAARGPFRRRWLAGTAAATALLALAIVLVATLRPPGRDDGGPGAAGAILGRLDSVAGQLEVAGGGAGACTAENQQPVRSGQTFLTRGQAAGATIRLEDGTLIFMAGDTRIVFPAETRDRIDVAYGNVTAVVRRRPDDRPLFVCTAEARVEVLGTRISISRTPGRTHVAVLEGEIRVERLSDQRTVHLAEGQVAEVSPQADLRPAPLRVTPDHWLLDFGGGLPSGWQTGQLVFGDLPEGSKAAVRAAAIMEHGQQRYQIRSHNAWSDGLFALHDDSWIHIRYRLEKPGTFLLYVVCRQHDFGEPVATVLTPGNLRQTEAGRWHTLTLSTNRFRRARTRSAVPLDGRLVAFLLVFDSPAHNPGLTVDRVWVTRGKPAQPRSPIWPDEHEPMSGLHLGRRSEGEVLCAWPVVALSPCVLNLP